MDGNDGIERRVMQMVAEVLHRNPGGITLASRFIEDLEANSLDVVEVACLLEGEVGRRISEEEITRIRTVGDVVHAIRSSR